MLNIKYIFTDFDGVLTDNKVYVSSNGLETVLCNRSDGIAINALKAAGIKIFILSTETNSVVKARGDKLTIETFSGIKNKKNFLEQYIIENNVNLENLIFIGNDINDLGAINFSKYSACPSDANNLLKKKVTFVLKTEGGEGVLREIAEDILNLNLVNLLGYNE